MIMKNKKFPKSPKLLSQSSVSKPRKACKLAILKAPKTAVTKNCLVRLKICLLCNSAESQLFSNLRELWPLVFLKFRSSPRYHSHIHTIGITTWSCRFPLAIVARAVGKLCRPGSLPRRRLLLRRGRDMGTLRQLHGRHEDPVGLPVRHLHHRSRAERAR